MDRQVIKKVSHHSMDAYYVIIYGAGSWWIRGRLYIIHYILYIICGVVRQFIRTFKHVICHIVF